MILTDNLRGIMLMVFGMFGFAVTDTFIKLLGGAVPTGQIMMCMGAGAGTAFLIAAHRRGRGQAPVAWRADFLRPIILWRNLFEVLGTMFFLTALLLAPLSVVSAIIQANPLIVTLGAALWLKEPVGPWRWGAIFVGLFGVLLVIQPWGDGFHPASLVALLGVAGLSFRDLVTRRVPRHVSTLQLSVYALYLLVPAGYLLCLISGTPLVMPTPPELGVLALAVTISTVGYFGTTAAMRFGDVGVVTPFRYSRIVFALILAITVFGERPGALTYLGAFIIVASGLFTLWRERRRKT